MSEANNSAIRINDLEAGYGNISILVDVNLDVFPGESVSVLGLNGAGKSTLLKAVAGVAKIMAGSVILGDTDLTRLPAHRRISMGLAYVGQGQDLFPKMTVRENIVMGGYTLDKRLRQQRLQQALEFFPALNDKRAATAGTLSGGQRQQLKLARAMMTAPKFLMLDEPSAGLSPVLVDAVFENVQLIIEETGAGVLLVEQNIKQALRTTDRAMILSAGRPVFSGTTAELNKNEEMKHRYLGV